VDGRTLRVKGTQRAISAHRCAGTPTAGCRAATPVTLTVQRGGQTLRLSVYPRYNKAAKRMLIGFGFGEVAKHYSAVGAAGVALHEMWQTTTSLVTNIGRAFSSSKVRHQFHSIIGITEIGHDTVLAGAGYAVVFLGFISLILAVINLFPFLPLDGGHVLWSLAEKVRGKRISLAAMYRYSSVGIILLLFLVINGVSNDLSRLTG
jgi:regulator of sigma E protease